MTELLSLRAVRSSRTGKAQHPINAQSISSLGVRVMGIGSLLRYGRTGRRAPRRWDLSEEELRKLAAMRQAPRRRREAVSLLLGDPRQVREIAATMLAGARYGALNSNALASLIDGRRVQRAVPGAARSVDWADAGAFMAALAPFLTPTTDALELGCGDGRISRIVAPQVSRLVCTDVSRTMVAEARENLADYDNVRCETVDGFTLGGLADSSCDVAFAQGVLTYLDPAPLLALLDEVSRVLRPAGTCVFNFLTIDDQTSLDYFLTAVRAGAAKRRFGAALERPYAESQIEAMYRAVGLDVVSSSPRTAGGRINIVGRTALVQ